MAGPLLQALVAAARTFADELERGLDADLQPASHRPTPGTAASMTEVLGSVARINDELGHGRGTRRCVRSQRPRAWTRGVAGYYNAGLLEKRSDGTRWILPAGRERLERLAALQNVHLLASDG